MKNILSIFSDDITIGRPQTSTHGKLFGGDSLYEVLAVLAVNRRGRFTVLETNDPTLIPLASETGRTPTQTRREVRKLETVGVLEEVDRRRKTEIYAVAETTVAKRALELPEALVEQLGQYKR